MSGQPDLLQLRTLIDHVFSTRARASGHKDLPDLCDRLGLPQPPPQEGNTKAQRADASLAACPDTDLPAVAEAILAGEALTADERNGLQDTLWAGRPHIPIPARTRRELAQDLDLSDHIRYADRFMALLDSVWVLEHDVFGEWLTNQPSLRSNIERHFIRFPDDWSTETLFEELGAFEAPHPRFGQFLERLASSAYLPDEPAQRAYVETANRHLQPIGAQLRHEGDQDGYPLFHLVGHGRGTGRRPRNLIFATLGKPDIRFTSALDNDIEIAERADQVLVYDRPVGKEGLRWHELRAWWQETRQIPQDQDAGKALYDRMEACLPSNSPGQRNLFWLYYRIHRDHLDDAPALLPEIWIHWDPKSVRARGDNALKNLRMDFLMLLPGGHRVVLEVDGLQHYTRNQGTEPDSGRYAATMAGDRELTLRGYEVFRFGHDELRDRDRAHRLLTSFFQQLLDRSPQQRI
ncbi:hypothetical protein [Streptomyces ficellus]|uniref:AbiJ-NTD3 domain-containing protein n=1 Tax=Streptomyces ficellus TaxID=1977088 RepID=A0A6I6FGW9_9ACTN|nr:hypothetical protein [Streptomyces ficellus]QGV79332.1 hypothetical protein EIZ62_14500 [Streptomyces ficellus]